VGECEIMLIVVGLGNPGKEYAYTRHNMGFLVVQALARKYQAHFEYRPHLECEIAKASGMVLLLPQTFMNESGRSVHRFLSYYKRPISELLVVVDDMDLPFGTLRRRSRGSSGGHNGLKSIQSALGTSEYERLRIGIGRDESIPAHQYVLSQFSAQELVELPQCIEKAIQCIENIL